MIRALDIFCGVGGSSFGAYAAGVEIAAGIDMWPVATSTYASNFNDAHVTTARLEDLDLNCLRRQVGTIDMLLASPECTNHTCAKGGAPRSESSRATAMHVVDFAETFRPRWIMLENVVYMKPWSRYEELKQKLRCLGYHLEEYILDASDFGVPQTRRRLFLVGDRKRKPSKCVRKPDLKAKPATSILDPFGIWKTSPLFHKKRAVATLERAKRGFQVLGEKASFLLVYYGSDGSGGWQPLSRPLRTVTTIDRFALVEHEGPIPRMRMLQVPELKRAMGFDSSFKMPFGSRRDRVRLLGNAVCPPVAQAVVQTLISSS